MKSKLPTQHINQTSGQNQPSSRMTFSGAAVICSVLASVLLFGSGCTITMKHGKLTPPAQACSGSIKVAQKAVGTEHQKKGASGRVGWGRFTIFAIPVVPIYMVGGDGNMQVANQIKEALTAAGYQVEMVEGPGPGCDAVLLAKVDHLKYNNYTWIFPFVPTWGRMKLDVSLQGPDQRILWNQQFEAKATNWAWFLNGYSKATKSCTTKILNNMISAFSAEDFRTALAKATTATASVSQAN
jgi:hypothetical protein